MFSVVFSLCVYVCIPACRNILDLAFSKKIYFVHIHTLCINCVAWLTGKCLSKFDRPRKKVVMDKDSGQFLVNVNCHTLWDWFQTLYKLPRMNLYKTSVLVSVTSWSSRLTAFVLKSFAQSRGFIFIDPEELRSAKSWLITHQKNEGSFPAMGRILNKDLQVHKWRLLIVKFWLPLRFQWHGWTRKGPYGIQCTGAHWIRKSLSKRPYTKRIA